MVDYELLRNITILAVGSAIGVSVALCRRPKPDSYYIVRNMCPECRSKSLLIGRSTPRRSQVECQDCGASWLVFTDQDQPELPLRASARLPDLRMKVRQHTVVFECGRMSATFPLKAVIAAQREGAVGPRDTLRAIRKHGFRPITVTVSTGTYGTLPESNESLTERFYRYVGIVEEP